jgi:hypothetical protein
VGGAAVVAVPDMIQPVGAGGVHIGEAVLCIVFVALVGSCQLSAMSHQLWCRYKA